MHPLLATEVSRAEFMRTEGGRIYDGWLDSLLGYDAEIDERLQQELAASPQQPTTPGRLDRFAAALGNSFQDTNEANYFALQKQIEANWAVLGAYTSGSKFTSMTAHALDSLRFGIRFPLATTFDAMREALGARTAEEEVSFISAHLGSASLLNCMRTFATTGFDIWRGFSGDCDGIGKKARAQTAGLVGKPWAMPAIMRYDPGSDEFSPVPGVETTLRGHMRRQNREGLSAEERTMAGSIPHRELPLTAGCPVARTGALAMCRFMAPRLELVNS